MRFARAGFSALLAGLLLASPAGAAPVFIASPPVVDREAGEMELLVGGISEDGTAPFVALAIAGRLPDGWFPVSQITVH